MFRRKESLIFDAVPYIGPSGFYLIDPVHSTIGFYVRHAVKSDVRGEFTAFEGLIKLGRVRAAGSEAHVSVQTGSVDTGSPERDAWLTGPDFLDSATFPLMSFRSTGIIDAGDDRSRMAGYLRTKDVELPVHVDLEFRGTSRDPNGDNRVEFRGTATLQPAEWGLDGNPGPATSGVLLGGKVELLLDISAVRRNRTHRSPSHRGT
ncbi:YceI family protein [Streptomyces sp. NPDC050743]|uniref:YceI family protein n=1 Tax=Streptomyces sp. NPDC050743 TaxID=3365634 RepID=UPI0037A964E4